MISGKGISRLRISSFVRILFEACDLLLVWFYEFFWFEVLLIFFGKRVSPLVFMSVRHADGAAAVTLFDHVVALFDGCSSGVGVEFLMFEAGYSVLACWIGGVVLSLI